MEQNKTSKYFKYAIGEIVLVVIGILIALSINNWNENRKNTKLGHSLMKELISEFQLHLGAFDYGLENQIESLENQQKIFNVINLESVRTDRLFDIFGFANIDVNIASNTYEKIKNQGIAKLTKNDSLNNTINHFFMERIVLYNRRIDYYLERTKSREKYLNESNLHFKNNLVKGIPVINEEIRKEQLINLIKTPRTQRTIIQSYNDKVSAIEYLIRRKKIWIELMTAIHKELLLTESNLEPLPSFDKYLDYSITE